jgi:hypothetical protein
MTGILLFGPIFKKRSQVHEIYDPSKVRPQGNYLSLERIAAVVVLPVTATHEFIPPDKSLRPDPENARKLTSRGFCIRTLTQKLHKYGRCDDGEGNDDEIQSLSALHLNYQLLQEVVVCSEANCHL